MLKKYTYEELEQKAVELEKKLELSAPSATRHFEHAGKVPTQHEFVFEPNKIEETLHEKEAFLTATLESTTDGLLITDTEGGIIHSNKRFAEMLQISPEKVATAHKDDLINLFLHTLQNPEDIRKRIVALRESLAPGLDTLKFKDGRLLEVHSRALMINKKLSGRVWSFRDITDLEKANRDLNAQLELHKTLLETIPNPIYIKNMRGEYTTCNKAFSDFIGRPVSEIIGKSSLGLVHDLPNKSEREALARMVHQRDLNLLANAGTQTYEWKVTQSTGQVREVLVSKAVFKDTEGHVSGLIAVITDVTKLKHVERTLSYLLRFRGLIMDLSTRFVNLPPDQIDGEITQALKTIGAFIHADRAYVYHFTENRKEIDNTYEWCAQSIAPHIEDFKNIPIATEVPWFYERLKAGKTCCYPSVSDLPPEAEPERIRLRNMDVQSTLVVPIRSKGSLSGFLGFNAMRSRQEWSEDIVPLVNIVGEIFSNALERKVTDEAVKKSEERLSRALEATQDGVWDWDYQTGNIFYSPRLKKMLSFDDETIPITIETVRARIPVAQHPALKKTLQAALSQKKTFKIEHLYKTEGNVYKWVQLRGRAIYDADGRPIRVNGSLRDITKRKRDEEIRERLKKQLQESQKMEAIATLAGGIAHEFNNALVGIYGSIALLETELPADEQGKKSLKYLETSAQRMAKLTNQLLAYARGGKYMPKKVALDNFMEDALSVIRHSLHQTTDSHLFIETDFSKDDIKIQVDTTQLQMVLSAILTNASEAMEANGTIRITTRVEDMETGLAKDQDVSTTGPYACISVRDTGKGMNEETKTRIFEPFYTTKFQGRGLGMAAVYGIVRNHGGAVRVESELGKGTEVSVYLPMVKPENNTKQEMVR